MADGDQLSFGDGLLSNRRKISKLSKHLHKLDEIIDWQLLVREISIIDKTDKKTGRRPRKNPLWMIKATFLQSLFSLSDPQLEDQLIDRLSFQRFVGINLDQEIPDFTTFWRFKVVLSNVNIESKLIRKATFTPASVHDSTQIEKLISYDEKALFRKKAYVDGHHKHSARHYGWYYGLLDKAKLNQPLSGFQKKRNHKLSSVRAAVKHPFAWMKIKARFVFASIGWNLSRAGFLLEKTRSVRSVAL